MEIRIVESASEIPSGCLCYFVPKEREEAAITDFTLLHGLPPDAGYRHGVALWLHPTQPPKKKKPPLKKKKSPVEEFFEDD